MEQPVQEISYRELAKKYAAQAETLRKAASTIREQHEEISKLQMPPNAVATFLRMGPEGTLYVMARGAELRVEADPKLLADARLHPGQRVLLNEAMVAFERCHDDERGVLSTVVKQWPDGRVSICGSADEELMVLAGLGLQGAVLKAGDTVLLDAKSGVVTELVERDETADLLLEKVPDIAYTDIGGLASQIEEIRNGIELPYLHPDKYAKYHLRAPKGILLYGPPGCGKTLVAKAIANSLAKEAKGQDAQAYFINIKGPELLNKWVGETERQIRLIFERAREKASEGLPVIVFFDEMDSMFRMRGSGISSDMESTIVPQLLAELDGVEDIQNVIVIGASNREDLIDPALLRPGRLDIKVKIDRPDEAATKDIFTKYLTEDLPYAVDAADVRYLIDLVTKKMFAENEETQFIEITYANGTKEILYFKDLISGAMIESIVSRAKQAAILGEIAGARFPGISAAHLEQAVVDEFAENKDLPNTTSPDDWAKISGRKGERIVGVKNLLHAKEATETVATTGQYL